ncbi:M23 family metallopeptidase [Janibacter sp. YIM B02568]|uniref:M23 family metallopeptidase n=1 Tax=Janibacter endophyticus TaxID=2806261 RepID=UPI0019514365|nr:M23 family metallopeptidase [Janibacter endophyticus]MBM6545930.1 M23 family metallopeptidase [Janibacter endophyticus]
MPSSTAVLAAIAIGLVTAPVAVTVVHPQTSAAPAPASEASAALWVWPLVPRPEVVSPFDAPSSRWGPGHRGLDLRARPGQEVRAAAAGIVTHRGRVAGRGTLTVTHPDGIRSTYEPVTSRLPEGTSVEQGAVIGRVSADPGHCAPATCLHLGALRGRDYLDPIPFFGGTRVILLPVP